VWAYGTASGGSLGIGVQGISLASYSGALNIGVAGLAYPATSGTYNGAVFGFGAGTSSLGVRSNAVVLLDNSQSTSDPFLIAQGASATQKMQIASDGSVLTDTLKPNTSGGAVSLVNDGGLIQKNTAGTEGRREYTLTLTSTNSMTATEMSIDDSGSVFLPTIANGESWRFDITMTALGTSGTNVNLSETWSTKLLIKRVGGSNVTFVGSPTFTQDFIDGALIWQATLVADTTNQRLAVKFAGDSSTTVRVRAAVRATRVS
jgi:hypothetical protein